jgi:hypothetical protein
MILVAKTAPANSVCIVGFDTVAALDALAAQRLAGAGLRFALRYVGLSDGDAHTLRPAEVEALARADLAIMPVQYARTGGWSAETGRADGEAAALHAAAAGLPADVTLWCDLEGAIPSGEVALTYTAAWYRGATAAGAKDPGLYVGAGPALTGTQLYVDLPFHRYWRSLSQVPNVDRRGYQMIQLFPGDETIAGVRVDLDVVQSDYFGDRPRWAVAA